MCSMARSKGFLAVANSVGETEFVVLADFGGEGYGIMVLAVLG